MMISPLDLFRELKIKLMILHVFIICNFFSLRHKAYELVLMLQAKESFTH